MAKLADGRVSLAADQARYWADLLGDATFDEAVRAVKAHQRESDRVILPVHIIDRVMQERKAAIEPASARRERQRRELEEYRKPVPLTDDDRAAADAAFQEALAEARARRESTV